MRRRALALVVMFAVGACGTSDDTLASGADSAEMMAAALDHLVTEDHTFGQGPPPFTEYLIEEQTVPIGIPTEDGDGETMTSRSSRPLTDEERAAIEVALSEHGPVRWIEEPDEWREDLQPTIEGSVILGVDVPRLQDQVALVPVSLWCGGVCGTWLTYRLEEIEGEWQVTGIEGPVAIS